MNDRAKLAAVIRRDPRYAYEAYEFLFQALQQTQRRLAREPQDPIDAEARCHVSGPELLEGVRALALQEFGLMARTVLRLWGIRKTDDFGEIVFNLVDAELMSKTDDDTRADFRDVFDLDEALVHGYRIQLDEAR